MINHYESVSLVAVDFLDIFYTKFQSSCSESFTAIFPKGSGDQLKV